ncbi:MAG: hypothetical protein NWE94_03915 [Candidatus Bathyarchaeota archaeon]|nr:hypothetical protein [Candidatus Bathyarchaeota archaeon]
MKKKFYQIPLLLIILGLIPISPIAEVFGADYSSAPNYERTYTFDAQYGYYRFSHRLHMSIPPSLYEYYHSKSHFVNGDSMYAKLVTPEVFASVAENIRNVTDNLPYSDEQFANAVLMLVRQIPYIKSNVKYPAETIIENSGDCDVLSLLAASIMKAGGLDVVLLYYKNISPSHMNVGVHLPYSPAYQTWWMTPASFEYNNKTYWMAECTALAEWKVGDRPELLAGATPHIIPLGNCEVSSPARISSSLEGTLPPANVTITLSSENVSSGDNWRTLTIAGAVSPAQAEQSVAVYVSQEGSSRVAFKKVSTDEFGNYSLTWNFTSTGIYHIKASSTGLSDYSGSDSETITVFIGLTQPATTSEVTYYYWGGGFSSTSASAGPAALYKNLLSQRGKEILQSNLTGKTVLLSGEFIVLSNGQNTTTPKPRSITIPGTWQAIRMPGRRGIITIWRAEETVLLNEQTANQFGFTLQHIGGENYTATVKVLSDDDVSQMAQQLEGENTALVNASLAASENTWYRVATKMSENEITAELYDESGALVRNVALNESTARGGKSGILMTYDKNAVIAFKNLKAETLDQNKPLADDSESAINEFEAFAPYVELTLLLAVAVAAIAYVKERKRARPTQGAGS